MTAALALRPGDCATTDDGRSGYVREMLRVFDAGGEDRCKSRAVISIRGIAVVKTFSQIGVAQ